MIALVVIVIISALLFWLLHLSAVIDNDLVRNQLAIRHGVLTHDGKRPLRGRARVIGE